MVLVKQERKKTWKDLKKKGLVEAVVQVLSQEGIDGLTMDNVAMEAGVAKGTLYSYFENKQDLLRKAIDAVIDPMVEELTAILRSDLPAEERLKRMTVCHLSYFEEHRALFRIFMDDRLSARERLNRYRSCRYQGFLEETARVIDQGIHHDEFRNVDSLKMAAMLVESNIAVIHQRLVSDAPGDVETDAAMISGVFLQGISKEKL